jgi:UDP-2,4-diacetamido-2,4,6-trideoxy-beta-L-altropyranose hydrolase
VLPPPDSLNIVQPDKPDYSAWLGVEQSEDAEQTIEALGDFKPDWLVVDHYGLDESWEKGLKGHVDKIFVIDDLANRPHDCDVLLNQNLLDDLENTYKELVPQQCRKLLGPRFALLRPEFRRARETLRGRDGIIRRILVFFGGVDPTGETEKALEALEMLRRPDIAVDVVVGSNNPNGQKIEAICRGMNNVTFHQQISNMAELMAAADLAIGAGGTASWERCCLGLPAVVTIIADNQAESTRKLAQERRIILMGNSRELCPENYLSILGIVLLRSTCEFIENGLALVDGLGTSRTSAIFYHPNVRL